MNIYYSGSPSIGIYYGAIPIIAVYYSGELLWSLSSQIPIDVILSCFSNGYWIDEYQWTDQVGWTD